MLLRMENSTVNESRFEMAIAWLRWMRVCLDMQFVVLVLILWRVW